jgi:plastocyanin domain-containing protein
MNITDWSVIAAGLGAIAWVNWYFFVAGRQAVAGAQSLSTGPAQVTIVVDGGYTPSTVRVKTGEPVRLVFDRRDTGSCSEEVVFPDFSLRRFLPTGQRTTIDVTPPAPGRYEFMCGMSMLRGALVAE